MGEAVHGWGQRINGKCLHLLLNCVGTKTALILKYCIRISFSLIIRAAFAPKLCAYSHYQRPHGVFLPVHALQGAHRLPLQEPDLSTHWAWLPGRKAPSACLVLLSFQLGPPPLQHFEPPASCLLPPARAGLSPSSLPYP